MSTKYHQGEVIALKDFVNELFFQLSKHNSLKNNINFGAIDYRRRANK